MLCKKCGNQLAGKQTSFCSKKCSRRYLKLAWQKRNPDVVNAAKKKWRLATSNASAKKWKYNNPQKLAAHRAVNYAIKTGKLIAEKCEVCGDFNSQAHHDDYSKKLKVRWLCAKHHSDQHHK